MHHGHPYEAPIALIRAAQEQAARHCGFTPTAAQEEVLGDTAEAVLEGAARMAREVLSPLNRVGDAQGSQLSAQGVTTAAGFPAAWQQFCADGWPALAAPEDWGGQALPLLLSAATTEIWAGANLAFAMCPETAVGAVDGARGARRLRPCARLYLPPLVSGEWTAAMSLTEPQAGSDLSTVRTLAQPDGDAWRLSGNKIYISWGEHDLADEHRAPGAGAHAAMRRPVSKDCRCSWCRAACRSRAAGSTMICAPSRWNTRWASARAHLRHGVR